MSEKEPRQVTKASRGVNFEESEGLKRKLLVEPGIYPIIKNTVANFKAYPVVLRESMRQEETGTSRRYELSCFFSFPLDFIQREISDSVEAFFEYIEIGQSRDEAAFNTRENFSKAGISKRYNEFFAANKERIEKEKFEGA